MTAILKNWLVILFFATAFVLQTAGQVDSIPPLPPVFERVSIDHSSGYARLEWDSSPSSDVAGYIIYSFRNNEGYPIDTIHDPSATHYIYRKSASSFFSETFVIASVDSSVNASPLSNALSTIFTSAVTDTCLKKITIRWNSYISQPTDVTGYSIIVSLNGGSYSPAGEVADSIVEYTLNDFADDAQYCFVVKANLANGNESGSNESCLTTRMQNPPAWINADYATIDENKNVVLSFSYDILSEINTFLLEKKSSKDEGFTEISRLNSNNGIIKFTDEEADIEIVNFYRLSAVNNCNIPVISSNIASTMVLELSSTYKEIGLKWNHYRNWLGNIESYNVFINTGTGFSQKASLNPSDTSFLIDYKEILYDITDKEVCFYIEAQETGNPYGITGLSRSGVKCTESSERITVPNVFTPDGDGINDFFRPVLTFTPSSYHLVITTMKGAILFETNDFIEEWDGKSNGKPASPGVFLWFVRIKTLSGENISKTGSITIVNH
jgi:gliding motility-associated-like protein